MDGNFSHPMKESWDVLVVLDACRYDYFERTYGRYLSGILEKRISSASCTLQWVHNEFPDKYDDVVYVSANPFVASKFAKTIRYDGSKHFFRVIDGWKDAWDERIGTVLPQSLNELAIRASREFKGKKLIVHYIQPHYPFIVLREQGVKDRGYRSHEISRIMWEGFVKILGYSLGNDVASRLHVFMDEAAVANKVGLEVFRKAYESNLQLVLESVANLIDNLEGKVVVTADHGELLGEGRKFAHWCELPYPEVRQVPWLVVNKVAKKIQTLPEEEKVNEPPITQVDEELIRKRLEALGYA